MTKFEIFPLHLAPDPSRDMLSAAAKFQFPQKTVVNYYGVEHTPVGFVQLEPWIDTITCQSNVVAIELHGIDGAGDKTPQQAAMLLSNLKRVIGGESVPTGPYIGLIGRAIGHSVVKQQIDAPDVIFVDVHDKPVNARRMAKPNKLDLFQAAPDEMLGFLRGNARWMHYRERTVVGQLNSDAKTRLPYDDLYYSLIMGSSHILVAETLKRAGVETTLHTLCSANNWTTLMTKMIRQGYPITRDHLPHTRTERRKVFIYDYLMAVAFGHSDLSGEQALVVANAISPLDEKPTFDIMTKIIEANPAFEKTRSKIKLVRNLGRRSTARTAATILTDLGLPDLTLSITKSV